MITIITKLPKDIELSPYLKSKAEGYVCIMHFGITYYVPITKEMKKLWKIKRKNKKFYFECSYKQENYLEIFLRDIVAGVYLQIRDTIGSEIHQNLSQEISENFNKLFDNYLEKRITKGMNRKLLEDKTNDK